MMSLPDPEKNATIYAIDYTFHDNVTDRQTDRNAISILCVVAYCCAIKMLHLLTFLLDYSR